MSFLAAVLPNGRSDPTLPLPSEVEVIEAVNQTTVYRLRYVLTQEAGDLPMLLDPRIGPEADFAIQVDDNDGQSKAVLVRGPVTAQHIRYDPGACVVDVIGGDYSIGMNRENKARVWPDSTDASAVQGVLAAYAAHDLHVDVQPTSAQHTEDKHVLVQRDTDLKFIRKLAKRNGYWFWFSYGTDPLGQISAHFRAPPTAALPGVVLTINGENANLAAVEIDWDVEYPTATALSQLVAGASTPADVLAQSSGVNGLARLLLVDVAPARRQQHLAVPADDAGDLHARGQGALLESDFFVRVQVSIKTNVLKRVIRTHSIVQLNGVGSRHSGKYLVWSVTHRINDGEHLMQVVLVRNGWN